MESMRDIDRAMEREIAKGELPVKVCEDRIWQFPLSGDCVKGKAAGGAVLSVADWRLWQVCRERDRE